MDGRDVGLWLVGSRAVGFVFFGGRLFRRYGHLKFDAYILFIPCIHVNCRRGTGLT